ncbi:transposase [Arthrobacter sp. SLBN-100]|uniref:transposase n=1 Tax=Arthrobacter sp. SLBN-100 TaxID=2768450 RepID=UPI0011549692
MLPSSIGRRGRPFRDDRRVVEDIIYRYRCGIAWRDVPAELVRGRCLGAAPPLQR